MPKGIKATNGNGKKQNQPAEVIANDVISWCNENHKRQKYEQAQQRKQAQRKQARKKAWKKHQRKENIFFAIIMVTLFLLAILVENAPIKGEYLNMEEVTGYTTTSDGLMLHTEDGNGYFFEN